jgi:hypothetical protein
MSSVLRVGKCSSSSQIPRGKLECNWTQGDVGGAQSPASVTGLVQAFVLVVPWPSESAMTRIGPVSSGMATGSRRVERVSFCTAALMRVLTIQDRLSSCQAILKGCR